MHAIAEGQPLAALKAILQKSPGGYIFLESSDIKSGSGLAEKRLGMQATAQGWH